MGRPVDPRKQFSKTLAGRTAWFWFFYMTLLAALIGYRPEATTAVIAMASLVTAVMLTSVLAYTHNSEYEKGLYTANQIAKLKVNFKEAFGTEKKTDPEEEPDELPDGEEPEETDDEPEETNEPMEEGGEDG